MASNISFSQTITEFTFETYHMIVIVEGVEKANTNSGFDCIMYFDPKTEIFKFQYTSIQAVDTFQLFKIVERSEGKTFVQFVDDDSPVIIKYELIDMMATQGQIDIISTASPVPDKEIKIIHRYKNHSD